MQLFRSKKQETLLGVDISSTSVKVLELSVDGGRFRVEHYAIEPVPQNALQEKVITDTETVGSVIAHALKRSQSRLTKAAAAVSGSAVITKVIDVDKTLSDSELDMQIRMDAEQYIPYPLSDVNLDFEVVGPSDISPHRKNVLLAASRKENIESRVDSLEIGGLKAKVMDIEAYAIERAASLIINDLEGAPDLVAVFDLGHSSSTLMVLHNEKIIYTREQAFGGAQLVEEIQRRYGMGYEDARNALLNSALPEDYQQEVLLPYMELAVQQICRSLQFFYSNNKFNDVDHILLLGGSARMAGFSKLIKERLGNRVSIANPFVKMVFSSKIDPSALERDAPSLMVACGLALRSFE